ncbi:protein Mis18-alpha [Narcine bancroftii]|uniref:protein Mis18-alpha n=1 Tax=Narcine bancroftii TaxID=1343680 RepID=UPI0038318708
MAGVTVDLVTDDEEEEGGGGGAGAGAGPGRGRGRGGGGGGGGGGAGPPASAHARKLAAGPCCLKDGGSDRGFGNRRRGGSRRRAQGTRDDSDLPVVFLCSQCRLPVGDSLAWAGASPKENVIYLKITCCKARKSAGTMIEVKTQRLEKLSRSNSVLYIAKPVPSGPGPLHLELSKTQGVTNNILVDKEQKIDTADESGCIYVLLSCSGCSLLLGRMYLCTPVHLDIKRNMYCLNVAYIESYVLGSTTNAEFIDNNKKPVVLETQAEVLEELAKSQTVLNLMIKKLADVEEKLRSLQGEG